MFHGGIVLKEKKYVPNELPIQDKPIKILCDPQLKYQSRAQCWFSPLKHIFPLVIYMNILVEDNNLC